MSMWMSNARRDARHANHALVTHTQLIRPVLTFLVLRSVFIFCWIFLATYWVASFMVFTCLSLSPPPSLPLLLTVFPLKSLADTFVCLQSSCVYCRRHLLPSLCPRLYLITHVHLYDDHRYPLPRVRTVPFFYLPHTYKYTPA